eukprot:gene32483-40090_t
MGASVAKELKAHKYFESNIANPVAEVHGNPEIEVENEEEDHGLTIVTDLNSPRAIEADVRRNKGMSVEFVSVDLRDTTADEKKGEQPPVVQSKG